MWLFAVQRIPPSPFLQVERSAFDEVHDAYLFQLMRKKASSADTQNEPQITVKREDVY